MSDREMKKTAKGLPDHSHNFHRKHMRERFYEAGFAGMADHNVLEMLLYFGIPRRDTNDIAHELINRFGSYADVFDANRHDLLKVKGMTETAACLIKMMVPFYRRYIENLSSREPSSVEPEVVAEYLRPKYYEGNFCEKIFVLCYDYMGHMITCRLLNEGDIGSSLFDIREFARVVLETNCSSVILSHNHPHSISLPSNDDVEMTRAAIDLLKVFKVNLIDHIIVSDDGYTSLANFKRTLPLFYEIDQLEKVMEEKNIE